VQATLIRSSLRGSNTTARASASVGVLPDHQVQDPKGSSGVHRGKTQGRQSLLRVSYSYRGRPRLNEELHHPPRRPAARELDAQGGPALAVSYPDRRRERFDEEPDRADRRVAPRNQDVKGELAGQVRMLESLSLRLDEEPYHIQRRHPPS
jgi:hypothetical protein